MNSQIETEVAIYCKISDIAGLNLASEILNQQQWETKFENGSRCRIRKESPHNVKGWIKPPIMTIKVEFKDEVDGVDKTEEHSIEVSDDFLEGFKKVCSRVMSKVRYIFITQNVEMTYKENGEDKSITVPNIKYEVDTYIKKDGTISEWCKIDVEIDPVLDFLKQNHPDIKAIQLNIKVSHLPFKPINPILNTSDKQKDKDFISKLWKEEFLS